MNLFTDDNPETTLHGLGFKNKGVALASLDMIENHFNYLYKKQKIPSMSPKNIRPKEYLDNPNSALVFFQRHKMTRVIGLLNRAKSLIKRTLNPDKIMDMGEAIHVLGNWMTSYHSDTRIH
jgi:hypothetical protein